MEIKVFQTIKECEKFRKEWDALATKASLPEMFFGWISSYWKYLNKDSELFVVIAKKNEKVIGIAPFKIIKKKIYGIKARCLEFIASDESNYQDILGESEEIAEEIIKFCLSNYMYWDMINLYNFKNKLNIKFAVPVDEHGFIEVKGSFDEYKKSLNKKVSKEIRHSINHLKKKGEVRLMKGNDQIIETYFNLHKKRWNQTKTKSKYNDPKHISFSKNCFNELKDFSEIYELRCNKDSLGVMVFEKIKDYVLLQNTAFNIDYAKYSPGKVLFYYVIKHLFNNKIKLIDFGKGIGKFKSWFITNSDKIYNLRMFNNSLKSGYLRMTLDLEKVLKEKLRSHLIKLPLKAIKKALN